MEKVINWKLSNRLISYFASSIYGENSDIIAIREALQNSVDSKAKNFIVTFIDDFNVTIENDGKPMELQTIENQLFVLGESTKTSDKEVGFFGVGECAIISPCESWKIITGEYEIENFTLRETNEYYKGTKHILKFKESLRRYGIKGFLTFHNVKAKITLIDKYGSTIIKPQNLGKCRKYVIPKGSFTWKKSGQPYTVLRVNGVPQKTESRYDNHGLWVIDLETSNILTVNRESVRDVETKKAIDEISETIRNLSGHVSGDKGNEFIVEKAPYIFFRKKGVFNRRDVNSKPMVKMYNALKALDDFFKETLRDKGLQKEFKHDIGLSNCGKDNLAMIHGCIILVNVFNRDITNNTKFILNLIDDYTHELAHIYYVSYEHDKGSAFYRKLAWDNCEILEALRKIVRS